jgi:hypothetical protein
MSWNDINTPPEAKQGCTHSRQVIVHYPSDKDKTENYGIAHYNYSPVYGGPHWNDYHHFGRIPDRWTNIPIND